jgi:peptidyl-prolyl isomerase D
VIKGKSIGPYSFPSTITLCLTLFSIVRQIENFPTEGGSDKPVSPIIIAKCGVTTIEETQEVSTVIEGDPYEDYPDDEDRDVQEPTVALEIAKAVREVGNTLFKEGKVDEALDKYQSKVFSPSTLSV